MRSIEADGVRVQLKAHALSAAMRKAIEIVEQFREAAEAGEDFVQRAGAAPLRERQARRVDEGKACELARTLVDQQVDAILGHDDVGFEEGA